MVVSISAAVLLSILVFLFVKKGGLKVGHAVVSVLLGFYLASSSIAPNISQATERVVEIIGKVKF